ncbi:MAG TPA: hypothetical protein VFR86_19280 [Burkholderiaceae bacterium]|nr:hypothetical protein [Burkholderiaceae bacterium]
MASPRRRFLLAGGLAVALGRPVRAQQPPGDPLTFAALGDTPYHAGEAAMLAAMIEQMNADPTLRFVVHVGDIKGGKEPCSDRLLRERHALLARIRHPWLFTPGDNEWTDCHVRTAGRRDPLDRLRFLRRLFYGPAARPAYAALVTESQAAQATFAPFVENLLFEVDRTVFATVHVVGSDNGLKPWEGYDPQDQRSAPRADRLAEFRARRGAALAWIDCAFARAAQNEAPAVVLFMHANPRFELFVRDRRRAGFNEIIERLRVRARAFTRPVLLIHGDRHWYLIDHPFDPDGAPNLTRMQVPGSPFAAWVKVRVEPQASMPFGFELRWPGDRNDAQPGGT